MDASAEHATPAKPTPNAAASTRSQCKPASPEADAVSNAVPNKPLVSVKPENLGSTPSAGGVAGATPKNKASSEVKSSFAVGPKQLQQQMKDAKIIHNQLAKFKEPKIQSAGANKGQQAYDS